MAVVRALRADHVIQYTGGNSAELVAAVASPSLAATVVSEAGGTLKLHLIFPAGEMDFDVHTNEWVRIMADWLETIPPATFAAEWIVKA